MPSLRVVVARKGCAWEIPEKVPKFYSSFCTPIWVEWLQTWAFTLLEAQQAFHMSNPTGHLTSVQVDSTGTSCHFPHRFSFNKRKNRKANGEDLSPTFILAPSNDLIPEHGAIQSASHSIHAPFSPVPFRDGVCSRISSRNSIWEIKISRI